MCRSKPTEADKAKMKVDALELNKWLDEHPECDGAAIAWRDMGHERRLKIVKALADHINQQILKKYQREHGG